MKDLRLCINEGVSTDVYFNITNGMMKALKKLASSEQVYDDDDDNVYVANVRLEIKNDKVTSIEIKDPDEDGWKKIEVY